MKHRTSPIGIEIESVERDNHAASPASVCCIPGLSAVVEAFRESYPELSTDSLLRIFRLPARRREEEVQ